MGYTLCCVAVAFQFIFVGSLESAREFDKKFDHPLIREIVSTYYAGELLDMMKVCDGPDIRKGSNDRVERAVC